MTDKTIEYRKLFNEYAGLITSIAKRYLWNKSCDIESLICAGQYGLIQALEVFDPTRGSFTTIATQKIRAAIQEEIRNMSRGLIREKYSREYTIVSIEEEENQNLADDRNYLDEERYKRIQEEIDGVLSELTPKAKIVIEYKFGLNYKSKLRKKEIRKIINLSKERVRQIEKEAMSKLRDPQLSKRLESIMFTYLLDKSFI